MTNERICADMSGNERLVSLEECERIEVMLNNPKHAWRLDFYFHRGMASDIRRLIATVRAQAEENERLKEEVAEWARDHS